MQPFAKFSTATDYPTGVLSGILIQEPASSEERPILYARELLTLKIVGLSKLTLIDFS